MLKRRKPLSSRCVWQNLLTRSRGELSPPEKSLKALQQLQALLSSGHEDEGSLVAGEKSQDLTWLMRSDELFFCLVVS